MTPLMALTEKSVIFLGTGMISYRRILSDLDTARLLDLDPDGFVLMSTTATII